MKLPSWLGWTILVGFVFYWDLFHHTLSDGFWRGLGHPKFRYFLIGLWVVLTLHLFNIVNPTYDPIRWIGKLVERVLNR